MSQRAAESGPTPTELDTIVRLLRQRDAQLVNVGHGRARELVAAADAFVERWLGAGGELGVRTDWAPTGASWLRPAQRLTDQQPDAWVIADSPLGFPEVAERLAASTDWDPCRTVAFDALYGEPLLALTQPGRLDGLVGARRDGTIWQVHQGELVNHQPRRAAHDDSTELIARPAVEVEPGAVHVPDWLSAKQQRELVGHCREWAKGPAPMRHTRLPSGAVMSVQTVCLGWHWLPYRYTRTADDIDGAPVAPFPEWLAELARTALGDAYGATDLGDHRPDAALINFYGQAAKLGMHQDKEERSDAPVVSLSIGDTCTFRLGNTRNRHRPYTDVELRSGDLFVLGGAHRFAYHGVPKVLTGTGDPAIGLEHGRLNLTLRVTGLAD